MTKKAAKPGAALVEAIVGGLPPGVELDERESALLGLAARQADDIARLEADIAKRGTTVPGSAGQPVLNPSMSEARQGRVAVSRILGQLDLPESIADATRRAQQAAEARWGRAG